MLFKNLICVICKKQFCLKVMNKLKYNLDKLRSNNNLQKSSTYNHNFVIWFQNLVNKFQIKTAYIKMKMFGKIMSLLYTSQ